MVASQRRQSPVWDATIGGTVDARIPELVDKCNYLIIYKVLFNPRWFTGFPANNSISPNNMN